MSVADNLKIEAETGSATIINYGGYPLGVDRISPRFVRTPITGPIPLIDSVALAIDYHLWDYLKRPKAKKKGLVYLCGGGFERLGRSNVESRIKAKLKHRVNVDVHFVNFDTKYLTLVGMGRLSRLGDKTIRGGEHISDKRPEFHGGDDLLKGDSSAETWYAHMANLVRSKYPR